MLRRERLSLLASVVLESDNGATINVILKQLKEAAAGLFHLNRLVPQIRMLASVMT